MKKIIAVIALVLASNGAYADYSAVCNGYLDHVKRELRYFYNGSDGAQCAVKFKLKDDYSPENVQAFTGRSLSTKVVQQSSGKYFIVCAVDDDDDCDDGDCESGCGGERVCECSCHCDTELLVFSIPNN